MTEITHPNIKDGWFTETQALWPGQGIYQLNIYKNNII